MLLWVLWRQCEPGGWWAQGPIHKARWEARGLALGGEVECPGAAESEQKGTVDLWLQQLLCGALQSNCNTLKDRWGKSRDKLWGAVPKPNTRVPDLNTRVPDLGCNSCFVEDFNIKLRG